MAVSLSVIICINFDLDQTPDASEKIPACDRCAGVSPPGKGDYGSKCEKGLFHNKEVMWCYVNENCPDSDKDTWSSEIYKPMVWSTKPCQGFVSFHMDSPYNAFVTTHLLRGENAFRYYSTRTMGLFVEKGIRFTDSQAPKKSVNLSPTMG